MKPTARSMLGAALGAVFSAALVLCSARAQDAQRITITGSAEARAPSVAGFGDLPLWRAPFAATVIDASRLQDAGVSTLGDIVRLDAGFTDAYNAPGYWNQVAVRGFTLDNRANVRRDGLPINAETALGAANKQRLELLKGTSGLQAGTSAPGGLPTWWSSVRASGCARRT
jgi:iron complex outermembrane recepter protein